MRISRQPSPVQIAKNQKQLKNVDYFHCLGSIITSNARCTREIKFRISVAKTTLNKIKTPFTSKFELLLRKKLTTRYIWSIAFIWCYNLDASEGRSEMSGNNEMWCWRRMSWTDHVRNEEVSTGVKEERNILYTIKRRKVNWIGHISRRNCLLKHVIEKKEERTDGKTR